MLRLAAPRPVTLLDLLTGNVWDEVMFDTVGATGGETGVVFYVVWLVLSRWLAVAMVVTVLFHRIDADSEDYLKIAAKNTMHSVFALERAFMQVRPSLCLPPSTNRSISLSFLRGSRRQTCTTAPTWPTRNNDAARCIQSGAPR